ncbi:MAG: hypothetical protein ACLS9R_06900 [Anaerobutyricum hallii]|uniref:hypothetical protein n=2 Tax=Lachnospiraceae TaxID=186803 RepID=UPI003992419D
MKEIEREIQKELLNEENWKVWKSAGEILKNSTEKTEMPLSDLDELLQEFFQMIEEKRIQDKIMPIQLHWFEE